MRFAASVPRHSRELDTRKKAHKVSKKTLGKLSQSRPRRLLLSVYAASLRLLSPRSAGSSQS